MIQYTQSEDSTHLLPITKKQIKFRGYSPSVVVGVVTMITELFCRLVVCKRSTIRVRRSSMHSPESITYA